MGIRHEENNYTTEYLVLVNKGGHFGRLFLVCISAMKVIIFLKLKQSLHLLFVFVNQWFMRMPKSKCSLFIYKKEIKHVRYLNLI